MSTIVTQLLFLGISCVMWSHTCGANCCIEYAINRNQHIPLFTDHLYHLLELFDYKQKISHNFYPLLLSVTIHIIYFLHETEDYSLFC